jgi:hypothetical protein
MSKHPVKQPSRALRKVDEDAVEVVGPIADGNPAFSFRYSYTEISAQGSTARVKSRNARYECGKLSTEAFEGEFDRSLYERMVRDAQRLFLAQTGLFIRALGSLLPLPGQARRDRD